MPRKKKTKAPCIVLPDVLERGWLFDQLIELDVSGRWKYLLKMQSERSLIVPIPYLQLDRVPNSVAIRSIEKSLEELSLCWDGIGYSNILTHFVDGLLHAFGYPNAEISDRYSEEKWRKAFSCFELKQILLHPCDYFGHIVEERKYGNNLGFHRTPVAVTVLMTLTMSSSEDCKKTALKKVYEPACGTGAILLQASNYSLFLYGAEINYLLHRICLLNMFLYAPWGVSQPTFLLEGTIE